MNHKEAVADKKIHSERVLLKESNLNKFFALQVRNERFAIASFVTNIVKNKTGLYLSVYFSG